MKIALALFSLIGGIASAITGTIIANIPGFYTLSTAGSALSNETPVSITLGLVFAGVGGVAIAAWKLSRAWANLENKIISLEYKIKHLECSGCPILTTSQPTCPPPGQQR